jgi:hypothetical protein
VTRTEKKIARRIAGASRRRTSAETAAAFRASYEARQAWIEKSTDRLRATREHVQNVIARALAAAGEP